MVALSRHRKSRCLTARQFRTLNTPLPTCAGLINGDWNTSACVTTIMGVTSLWGKYQADQ